MPARSGTVLAIACQPGIGPGSGHRADDTSNVRPASHKFEGRRSAHKAGDAAVNRAKPGRVQKKRALNNEPRANSK
jgi:hypothetical protein